MGAGVSFPHNDPKESALGPKNLNWNALFPGPRAFREAWQIFLFSFAFAVLFNALYTDGIELKAKPSPVPPSPGSAPVTSYAGWGQGSASPGKQAVPSGPIRLSLKGARDRYDKGDCLFLDARKASEYEEGHIAGAIDFSALEMDEFAPKVMPRLTDKEKEMIVYCNGGDCTLSLELAQALQQQGYRNVRVFEDGWPAWKKAAYPAHTGKDP